MYLCTWSSVGCTLLGLAKANAGQNVVPSALCKRVNVILHQALGTSGTLLTLSILKLRACDGGNHRHIHEASKICLVKLISKVADKAHNITSCFDLGLKIEVIEVFNLNVLDLVGLGELSCFLNLCLTASLACSFALNLLGLYDLWVKNRCIKLGLLKARLCHERTDARRKLAVCCQVGRTLCLACFRLCLRLSLLCCFGQFIRLLTLFTRLCVCLCLRFSLCCLRCCLSLCLCLCLPCGKG